MFVKRLSEQEEIVAGDHTRLRELLHPDNDPAAIGYSLAIARLDPGGGSVPHRLEQTEVYYIIRGEGTMHIGDESARVRAGDAVYIPGHAVQWLENDGEEVIEFACIVEPAWQSEDEQIL